MSSGNNLRFKRITIIWASIGIAVFASMTGYFYTVISDYSASADARHERRINPNMFEKGKTAPDDQNSKLESADIATVSAGVYIDRIYDFRFKENQWKVDFYVWFNWENETISPGDNFQIINGTILSKAKLEERKNGSENYSLYRVRALLTKFFNPRLFPNDRHLLTLGIEHGSMSEKELRFVADEDGSAISSRVKVSGYKIKKGRLVVKRHAYKTIRGDQKLLGEEKPVFSQLLYGIWIKRGGWGYYLRLHIGLFAAVIVAMVSFMATDLTSQQRFAVGAFFSSITAAYLAMSQTPNRAALSLGDAVNMMGIIAVTIAILHSVVIGVLKGTPDVSASEIKRFNRLFLCIFAGGYLVFNLLVPLASLA